MKRRKYTVKDLQSIAEAMKIFKNYLRMKKALLKLQLPDKTETK
jgi:hypothetical protein